MKKILLAVLVLSSLVAFVSCNKDGVYKPKNKLASVWYEAETTTVIDSVEHPSSTPKYLLEEWKWGDKFLESRTIYKMSSEIKNSYIYEYNKKMNNRLIGITSGLATEKKTKMRFLYDDDTKMLKEVRYFTADLGEEAPYKLLVFAYDGKKVASITETVNTLRFPKGYVCEPSLLSYLVSEDMAEDIEFERLNSKIEYDSKINEYFFEWEKSNIAAVTIKSTVGGKTSESKITYTYDKNKNPMNGRLMGYVEDGSIDYLICSKNNVLTCSYEDTDYIYSEECEYTYDKKVPVEKTVVSTTIRPMSMVKKTAKWTYEYVD